MRDLTTNLNEYPGGELPKFEKLEVTFQIDTSADDLHLPYDASPPPGVTPSTGITVDALFTPDNWQTIYRQPAFYFQDFQHERKSGSDWIYPTGEYYWKVRFSPAEAGEWQFRIVARDAEGTSESSNYSFTVVDSEASGFVRVSERDARYFEFDNGAYFPALGYNMNYRDLDWVNPVLNNTENFQRMSQNGIQLIRIWLSQWSIFGAEWNPWRSFVGNGYFPAEALTIEEVGPGSEVSLKISASWNHCVLIGWEAPRIPLKQNTDYRIGVRYKLANLGAPLDPGQPMGLVAKFGGWLWSDQDPSLRCDAPGTGQTVSPHVSQNTTDWQTLEGSFNSGADDFSDNFYLALENIDQGAAYIDEVWIREDLGAGALGPNLIQKPDMDHHTYFDQRNSYAFDLVLDLAEQNNVYLRPVILEKNDWILNRIKDDGAIDATNPINDNFYGDHRNVTRVRWLQQAWWRYVQARWGYSPNIHSWELLNEGDPFNSRHYALADEFGEYMHQFTPNDHLVSTSFWHSFPDEQFWSNEAYDQIDFADVHQYIPEGSTNFEDAAQATYGVSVSFGAYQPEGAGKPVIRGETGFVVSGSEPPTNQLLADEDALWLHNFIWGGINPGGLIESYWYATTHIYSQRADRSYRFDHRSQFKGYFDFIEDIPLNNGHYEDAQAQSASPDLRVWGQRDLVNGRAHLWIQNTAHTWKSIVDGVPITAVSSSVTLPGFQPGESYQLDWWDTYSLDPDTQVITSELISADDAGALVVPVDGLIDDIALKISPADPGPTPTFEDVPFNHWAYDEIEALYQEGYIVGCSETPRLYCPDNFLNRAESSVFVLRGDYGAVSDPPNPPPTQPTFDDVGPSFWGYGWIENLWQDGYTAGCSSDPLLYCPDQIHTRAEGSVFFLRILLGADYEPPAPSGLFSDVELDDWFAGWVEAAYENGILPECQQEPLTFCPQEPLDRAWAAYMMVQAKGGLSALSPGE